MASKTKVEAVKISVPKAKALDTKLQDDATHAEVPEVLKKGEVLDRLTSQSGLKRSDVKAVVEGFLDILAEDLAQGRDMQLPPLGKVKMVKSKVVGQGATALTIKIRQPKPNPETAG